MTVFLCLRYYKIMMEYVQETGIVKTTPGKLFEMLEYARLELGLVCFERGKNEFEICGKEILIAALDSFNAGNPENKDPVSETIEFMIKKNILLPDPDPETGKYITSGSTPETVAWIKLNNLRREFPPKLFYAMIKTKCKPWIIEKYYRDM